MGMLLRARVGLQCAGRLPAVEHRHAGVHQNEVRLEIDGLVDRFAAVRRGLDGKPGVLEVLAVELAGVLEIFCQQDERSAARRGHRASRSRE